MKKIPLLLLMGILAISSCKKDDPAPLPVTGEYYVDANIGGVQVTESIPVNNTDPNLEAGSSLGGFDDVVFSASIVNNNPGRTTFGISKGVMHNYFNATNAEFVAFFTPGNYGYAPYGSDGITIGWYDSNGTSWESDQGTGNQTGSTFSIISITEQSDLLGTLYVKAKVQFSCKLYDTNGNVKQATGTFVGLFGKI